MEYHCAIHVIHQDIQGQLGENILSDFFQRLNIHQTHQRFLTIKIHHKENTHSLLNHTNYSYQGTL